MDIFTAYGFNVIELKESNSKELFNTLEPVLVNRKQNRTLIARDIRILTKTIRYVFKPYSQSIGHKAFGLYKDNKIVGAVICNDTDQMPWIGHLNILENYRKTKATIVLMHFILNILYKDRIVFTGQEMLEGFEKHVMVLKPYVKMCTFKPESAARFANIINKEHNESV